MKKHVKECELHLRLYVQQIIKEMPPPESKVIVQKVVEKQEVVRSSPKPRLSANEGEQLEIQPPVRVGPLIDDEDADSLSGESVGSKMPQSQIGGALSDEKKAGDLSFRASEAISEMSRGRHLLRVTRDNTLLEHLESRQYIRESLDRSRDRRNYQSTPYDISYEGKIGEERSQFLSPNSFYH